MAEHEDEKGTPNAEALMRLAITTAIEDCWDVDCEECQVSAPVPCTEHLDLDEMIEQASLAALDILTHVRAHDLDRQVTMRVTRPPRGFAPTRWPDGMTATKLRDVADWLDLYDKMAERFIIEVGEDDTITGEALVEARGKEVQSDLRRWASIIERGGEQHG